MAAHRMLTPRFGQALGDKGVASLKGERLLKRFKQRYGADLPLRERGFNAGVFVFNLKGNATPSPCPNL